MYFIHCPSHAVGFGLNFRGANGKPTQLLEYVRPKLAVRLGASFARDFFDFVETSQDPDVHGTTSTVKALVNHVVWGTLQPNR